MVINPNIDVQNMPVISPYLIVADVSRAIQFYKDAFSFVLAGESYIESNEVVFSAMQYDTGVILIGKAGELKASDNTPNSLKQDSPVQLHVRVNNVDQFFDHASSNGAETVYPPEDKFWGERVCKLKDPDGHIWCFASSLLSINK